MKRLFLSLTILAFLSSTATINAQQGKRHGQLGEKFSKELSLTTEQQSKVESANDDFKTKITALRGQDSLSRDEKRSQIKDLRDQHHAAINNILTPEQQAKRKELRANKTDGRHSKMHANRSGRYGMQDKKEMYSNKLNLTDAQKEKIKALNENYKAKSKELSQQHRDELNKVYTPEQQAQMQEMRKDFGKSKRFAHTGKRGGVANLDEASKTKLKSLKENYLQEKKAIEMSRITQDAQKQKISALRKDFRKERRQIITDAQKIKENRPV